MSGFELSLHSLWKSLLIITAIIFFELIVGYGILSTYGFTVARVAVWSAVIVVSSILSSSLVYWRELRKMSRDEYYADDSEEAPLTESSQGETLA